MKQVDLVLFGHVHNYERTCSIYQNQCKAMPTKDKNGVDTYDNRNYSAPVHAVIGMAGFTLDKFPNNVTNYFSFPHTLPTFSLHARKLVNIRLFIYTFIIFWTIMLMAFNQVIHLYVLLHLQVESWSLKRISKFGYLRASATKTDLNLEVSTYMFLFQSQSLK